MLERIEPESADAVTLVDHYSRYLFASKFVKNKSVLDAACGVGYGSDLLKRSGAVDVIGVDISSEAVEFAKSTYQSSGLSYICSDICSINNYFPSIDKRFDVITSFETIEHVSTPNEIISVFASMLNESGVFISSVPDDIGNEISNPFHLHKFTRNEYHALLKAHFKYVYPFTQYFTFGSAIISGDKISSDYGAELLEWHEARRLERQTTHDQVFCFLAVCSNVPLELDASLELQLNSLSAWQEHSALIKRYETELLLEVNKLREELALMVEAKIQREKEMTAELALIVDAKMQLEKEMTAELALIVDAKIQLEEILSTEVRAWKDQVENLLVEKEKSEKDMLFQIKTLTDRCIELELKIK